VVTDNALFGVITTLTVTRRPTQHLEAASTTDLRRHSPDENRIGTLALSGNSTYTGATNAFGGNLQLDAVE
jgi:autotransporter-associated beta strand protein